MDLQITDSGSIRALSRMIYCAAKIGEHLQLSWQSPSTLSLRAINPSHSTYAHFRCFAPFLSSTTPPTSGLSFKLPCRSLLPPFRSSQSILSLRISTAKSCVVFSLHTRNALVKTFRVPVSDGRIGVTAFDKRTVSCTLSARASLFMDVLAHFHARLDEITFSPSQPSMRVASFVDDVSNPANVILRTEMTLAAREFDTYTFAKPHELSLTIFCKYFRAALDFCEPFDAPLRMWYEKSGHPVLFELAATGTSAEALFDAQFIFASRHAEEDDHQRMQQQASATTPASARRPKPHTQLQQMQQSGPTQITEPFHAVRDPPGLQPHPEPVPYDGNLDEYRGPAANASFVRSHHTESEETQEPTPGQLSLPSKRKSVFDEDANGDEEDGADDDADFVEGTPPP